ncbi:hypothetical protein [Flavivirga rizhaonensis]|uniref:STAS/SEC14 domain-containing protein n=1 Tax=Flavivirga rizhaonensis TaxID=2559571 RepID=A0A4S1E3B9_9FLAO|nr:hypothetical protein [Flavivirga rizhaonensis]TGV04452.1 hypothetical protein EM932_02700 [Flavivirga rizhaonensis]
MVSVKDTSLYSEVIKEFNYSFGTMFVFKEYVVSEINEGVVLNWEDHAKIFTNDIANFLGTKGVNTILISNRINSYSTIASDWLKFFKNNYSLKAYLIVSDEKTARLGIMTENLFFNKKIKKFNSLYEAVNYVKSGLIEIK